MHPCIHQNVCRLQSIQDVWSALVCFLALANHVSLPNPLSLQEKTACCQSIPLLLHLTHCIKIIYLKLISPTCFKDPLGLRTRYQY